MKHLALFIEPTAAQLNIFSAFTLPRLGSFILASLVNRRPSWRARVFIEGRKLFDLRAWMTEHGRPDLVGISTITATVKRGYALADECRAVVIGGASASSGAERVRLGACDLFEKLLPILAFANQHLDISIHFFKRLLHAQGIYPTPAVRPPILPFDDAHARVAQELIAQACALEAEVGSLEPSAVVPAAEPLLSDTRPSSSSRLLCSIE